MCKFRGQGRGAADPGRCDELLALTGGRRLRQRGPNSLLADAEVVTIEVVGELLGLDQDKAIFEHFRRYHRDLFPALGRIHRTTFARQAANLWAVKQHLWRSLTARVPHDPHVALVDSFPIPGCRFARAHRCACSGARRPSATTKGRARPSSASAATSASPGRG